MQTKFWRRWSKINSGRLICLILDECDRAQEFLRAKKHALLSTPRRNKCRTRINTLKLKGKIDSFLTKSPL